MLYGRIVLEEALNLSSDRLLDDDDDDDSFLKEVIIMRVLQFCLWCC